MKLEKFITERELLGLFLDGLECLSSRRHLDFLTYKELMKLLAENKIHIEIKCIHGTFGGIEKCIKCKEVKTRICEFPNCDNFATIKYNGKFKCEQHNYSKEIKE